MHLSPSSAVRRPAFTLLEVLLASAIAVLLMGALYVAVSIQLQHAQVARDLVQDSSLTRNLFARIAADSAPHLPPDIADEGNYVIAPEVRSLTFRYFGTAWQDSWDGRGPDGTATLGPPVAIEITIRIAPAGAANPDNEQSWKTYRHVVALPTA